MNPVMRYVSIVLHAYKSELQPAQAGRNKFGPLCSSTNTRVHVRVPWYSNIYSSIAIPQPRPTPPVRATVHATVLLIRATD